MTVSVSMNDIVIGERHRKQMGDLQALANNIEEQGLLHPIGITEDCELVFGERRLKACRDILGWEEIDCRIVNVTSLLDGEYSENEFREDWTIDERVAILRSLDRKKQGRPGKERPGVLNENDAARRAGFGSHDTAKRAEYIIDHAPQDVIDAVTDTSPTDLDKIGDNDKFAVRLTYDALKKAEAENIPINTKADFKNLVRGMLYDGDPPARQPTPRAKPAPKGNGSTLGVDTYGAINALARLAEEHTIERVVAETDKWTRLSIIEDLSTVLPYLQDLHEQLKKEAETDGTNEKIAAAQRRSVAGNPGASRAS